MKKKGVTAPAKEKEKGKKSTWLYYGSVIVLVIIVVSFVGGPMLSRMGSRTSVTFGTYDGERIVYARGNYFALQRDREADRLSSTDQEGTLESQLYQAFRYAFNQTVLHTAILVEAEKSGLWVTDDRVDESLLDYGPYLVNGEFSSQRYKATPEAERNAISRLRREVLVEQQYVEDLFAVDVQSSLEKDFLKSMVDTERRFALVSYNYADFPDDRVLAYGIANKEKFAKIKLSRILITSGRNEAEKVRDMVITGQGTFEDLARSFSKGTYAESGGDMGWQYYHYFLALFGDESVVGSIFELRQGDISELYASGRNWVFFRCDSEAVKPDFEDQETISLVRDYVANSERGVIDEYFVSQAEGFRELAEEKGFTTASVEKGLFPPIETAYFPVNYATVFSQKPIQADTDESGVLASAAFDEGFLTALFSLEKGEITEPITLGDNVVVATFLDERRTPEQDVEQILDSMEALSYTSLNRELGVILIDEDKLEDNFQETFFKYIVPY